MNWDDSLATGNAEIDAQHHKLVDLINQLHEAMRTGKGSAALSGIFDELIKYTDYHFKTEERLFGPVDYAQKDAHVKEHVDLVKQALGLQAKF
jgi:hemerythrin